MSDLTDAYLFLTLAGLCAMLVGGLLFSAMTTAPVAVGTLPEDAAARFLRAFWPRYYAFGAGGGALLTLCFGALAPSSPFGVVYGGLLTILLALFTTALWAAQRMIPGINAARDAADDDRFARRHRTVLLMTGLGLLAGLAFLAALGWVLPGQYLVWMQH